MSLEQFKDRNVAQNYTFIPVDEPPVEPLDKFKQVVKRTFKGDFWRAATSGVSGVVFVKRSVSPTVFEWIRDTTRTSAKR